MAMTRIRIEDLPQDHEFSEEMLEPVFGEAGLLPDLGLLVDPSSIVYQPHWSPLLRRPVSGNVAMACQSRCRGFGV